MEAKIFLAVMKFNMTQRSSLQSILTWTSSTLQLPNDSARKRWQKRSDRESPQQNRTIPAPGHSGGERQPFSEPSERTGYGRGVLVQHQLGELLVQGRTNDQSAEELYLWVYPWHNKQIQTFFMEGFSRDYPSETNEAEVSTHGFPFLVQAAS